MGLENNKCRSVGLYLPNEVYTMVRDLAAKRGITTAEYFRNLVYKDLKYKPEVSGDVDNSGKARRKWNGAHESRQS